MITSSPTAKVAALMLATTMLVGAMHMLDSDAPIKIEGGGPQTEAQMGSVFKDMTAGTLTSEPVEDVVVTPSPPETVQDIPATTAPTETVQASTATPKPTQAAPANVTSPSPSAALPVQTQLAAIPSPSPTTAQPSEPTEIVAAQVPVATAPPQSTRPKRRDPELAAKVEAARPKLKVAKAKPSPKKKSVPKGNAKRNNTKGAKRGTNQKAAAKTQGTKRKASSKSGNAAASNYPGKVMRRISRVRKPRVNSRGTAVIRFSISSSGGLARVSVSRSSGSGKLDSAAMAVIRKAAPFPAPPRGAQRQFSIRIKGR